MFWAEESEWYAGQITAADSTGRHHIRYDDGDTEWLDLTEAQWESLPATGSALLIELHTAKVNAQSDCCCNLKL